jgi:primary-amine oxidase
LTSQAASIVRARWAGKSLNFRFITLCEPRKENAVKFLDQVERGVTKTSSPPRQARVQIIFHDERGSNQLHELVVSLESGRIEQSEFLEGKHSYIDAEYMMEVEKACIANADVKKEIELLQLPPEATVIVEPWAYATDGMNDMSKRTSMV